MATWQRYKTAGALAIASIAIAANANTRTLNAETETLVMPAYRPAGNLLALVLLVGAGVVAWREDDEPQAVATVVAPPTPEPQAVVPPRQPAPPPPPPVEVKVDEEEVAEQFDSIVPSPAQFAAPPDPADKPPELVDSMLDYLGIGTQGEPEGSGIFLSAVRGSGKTTLLGETCRRARQRTNGNVFISVIDFKRSYYGQGEEHPYSEDGLPLAIVHKPTPTEVLPLSFYYQASQRLEKLYQRRALRAEYRVQLERTGRRNEYNPTPEILIFDEYNSAVNVDGDRNDPDFKEILGCVGRIKSLVNQLAQLGREDRLGLILIGQDHSAGSNKINRNAFANFGLIALSNGKNFDSIAGAINDAWVVREALERDRLTRELNALRRKGDRCYYSGRMFGHFTGQTPTYEKNTQIFGGGNNVVQLRPEPLEDPWEGEEDAV